MDYQLFRSEFEQSGLTQKEFSIRKGMSASMVCYYLRRAREQFIESTELDFGSFQEIQVQTPRSSKVMKISLPSGIVIELPID